VVRSIAEAAPKYYRRGDMTRNRAGKFIHKNQYITVPPGTAASGLPGLPRTAFQDRASTAQIRAFPISILAAAEHPDMACTA
jgi:hypothetical protein